VAGGGDIRVIGGKHHIRLLMTVHERMENDKPVRCVTQHS
jgi:hypothetical protein